jgi:malonyl-CoA/methylmalonyl-CoA synthetase
MSSDLDLSERIEQAAAAHPGKSFLKTRDGRELTYADLREQVARFGAVLEQLGAVDGERVLVQGEKSVETILLYAACLKVRAVYVPVNTANTPAEMQHFLNDAKPKLLVLDEFKRDAVEAAARVAGVAHIETLNIDGKGTFIDRVRRTRASLQVNHYAPQDLAAIVYTSGTTGRPKGAMLTRANLASNAEVLAAQWRFTGRDVLMHVLPLFHIHGLFVALNTVWVSGSSLLMVNKFDAAEAVRRLNECTVFMGVPTHYTRLLLEPGLNKDSSAGMRLFVSGSAPLLADTHAEFSSRTGHAILERYGMSETLINTSNPYEGARVPGSVGPPLPGTQLRIVAPEGEAVGGIEVKGPNVFAGYWRDEAKTRAEFSADGWFRTGDVGRIDAQGYVHIVGRAKDLVISGGFNVYPKEVESELDALEGVLESAVFGVPHPDFGEGVTAAVVMRDGVVLSEGELIARVQDRLARYKVPKRILQLAELPRNTMGKVQKNELRKTYQHLYRKD